MKSTTNVAPTTIFVCVVSRTAACRLPVEDEDAI